MKCIWVISLCMVTVLALRDRPCNKNPKINGCTIPGEPKFVLEDQFTPSCDHHDVCYYCHVQFNKTRGYCDRHFLTLMLGTCKSWRCVRFAFVYYLSVYAFGGGYFNAHDKGYDFCKEDWVPACV